MRPDSILDDAWISIEGSRIEGFGIGQPGRQAIVLDRCWIVPGFIDIHVHGGGGRMVVDGDHENIATSVEFHRRHGTTSTVLSLVTAPAEELLRAAGRISALLTDGPPSIREQVVGIHFEGPFLSQARCGALDTAHMVDPDLVLLESLLRAGGRHAKVMTIAPELPGALELIRMLVSEGIVAAIGHTDANFEQTSAAIAAGARLATHLGNAMRPFQARDPGPIAACLADPEVVCELIIDGHHLHPGFLAMATASKDDDGIALITDAIAAAGYPDGPYEYGGWRINVVDGVARLASTSTLAGSTLTMDAAFRNAVDCGLPITAASRATSLTPARVLGIDSFTGSIEKGNLADIVVLNEELTIAAVIARGNVVYGSINGEVSSMSR